MWRQNLSTLYVAAERPTTGHGVRDAVAVGISEIHVRFETQIGDSVNQLRALSTLHGVNGPDFPLGFPGNLEKA